MDGARVRAPELPVGLEWFNTESPLTLAGQRGKIVLLDFWTYCCINCLHVLQDLRYLERKYPEDLTVIGIHSPKFPNEKAAAQVQKAINRHHVRHAVANDPSLSMWKAYNIRAWPTLAFIDAEGYVIGTLTGEGRRRQLDDMVQEHLDIAEQKGVRRSGYAELLPTPEPRGVLSFPGKVLATEKNLYISDSGHNQILETTHSGRVLRVFGTRSPTLLDGPRDTASFNNPQGLLLVDDYLYVADTDNHAVRRINLANGEVVTVAGNGKQGRQQSTQDADPREVSLSSPWDLGYHDGSVFIAVAGAHQIWRLRLRQNKFEKYAGSGHEDIVDGPVATAAFAQPSGLSVSEGIMYVADAETSAVRVVRIPFDTVGTLVGQGLFEFGDRDGAGTEARLQHPLGVVADPLRKIVWIADSFNHKIKKLDLMAKTVTSITVGRELNEPGGLSLYGNQLYVANTNAHEILRINLDKGNVEAIEIDE